MTKKENKELYRQLIEKELKENPFTLDDKKIKEIKTLKREKPILLIGKDKKRISDAIFLIHITHPKVYCPSLQSQSLLGGQPPNVSATEREIKLKEYSCIGKNEQEIENALFLSDDSLINHYIFGEMLFVRGLNIPRILERLADSVERWRIGILIINFPSMDIIPQELLDRFEVIRLEPQEPKGKIGFHADKKQ